jgi:RNA polymerase sigma factor (sigma-70 family)
MSDNPEHSVSLWIENLKQGDQTAARQLWDRYFDRLVRAASRKMGGAARRVADEEDVAVSVFESLCRGAVAGNFSQLQDRDDLWRLLVAIARQKAVDQIRRQVSQKRGGTELRGESIFAGATEDGPRGFEQFLAADPTPEFLALMEEQQSRLFAILGDDVQRQIARLRMEGFSNEEIAAQLDISLRTVERKLGMIRSAWSREIEE